MGTDQLEVPSEFVGERIHIALRGMLQAKAPSGEVVPAFIGFEGTMRDQTPSSLIVHLHEDGLLGPMGIKAIPKDVIMCVTKVGGVALLPRGTRLVG